MPARKRTKTKPAKKARKKTATKNIEHGDESELLELFNQVDADGSGAIEFDEFLNNADVFGLGSLPGGRVRVAFNKADKDKSGAIEFEEFCAVVRDGRASEQHWLKSESNQLLEKISQSKKKKLFKNNKSLESISAFRHSWKVQKKGCFQLGNMCSNPDIGLAPKQNVKPDQYFITTGNGLQVEGRYSEEVNCCSPPVAHLVAGGSVGGGINMSTEHASCCSPEHWQIRDVPSGSVIGRIVAPSCGNQKFRVTDEDWNDKYTLEAAKCCCGLLMLPPKNQSACCNGGVTSWQQDFTVVESDTSGQVGAVAAGGPSIGGCGRAQSKLASYAVTTKIYREDMNEIDRQRIQALVYAFDLRFLQHQLVPRKVTCCGSDTTTHWKEFVRLHRSYPDINGADMLTDYNAAPTVESMNR